MKKILKRFGIWLRIIISICLICSLFVFSYNYLNRKFIGQIPKQAATGFKALPDNSMDVVVIGSSHAQYSFMPGLFYQESGLYSYVMASQCQPLPVSYQILKEVLKTQKPKMIILEIFTAMPLREMCQADSCYVAAQSLLTGEEKEEVLSYLPEEKAKEYAEKEEETYNDLLTNHNMWKDLKDFSFLLPDVKELERERHIDTSFGYVYQDGCYEYPDKFWPLRIHKNTPEVELDEEDLKALNNIYELCKENNIDILLYKTPIDSIDELNQGYRYAVWNWANERDIKYIDFVEMTRELKFYIMIHSDSFHANIDGAGIITTYISDFIKDNSYTFNHQTDETLEKIYRDCGQDSLQGFLIFEHLPSTYLKVMSRGYTGSVFIRYQKNPYGLDQEIIDRIKELGFTDFDGTDNYFAYAKDEKLIKSGSEELNENVSSFKIDINESAVYVNDEQWSDNDCYLNLVYVTEKGEIRVKNIDVTTSFDRNYYNYSYR